MFVAVAAQGSVEAMRATLDDLSAHVALRARALNPEVAQAAAAAGVSADDLGLMTLEQMEPQRKGVLVGGGVEEGEEVGMEAGTAARGYFVLSLHPLHPHLSGCVWEGRSCAGKG